MYTVSFPCGISFNEKFLYIIQENGELYKRFFVKSLKKRKNMGISE